MTSRHYRWQRNWAVDLGAQTATHTSGLVVRFESSAADPRALDGQPVNADAVLATLLAQHGPHNAPQMVGRLMREAGEIYSEALRERH